MRIPNKKMKNLLICKNKLKDKINSKNNGPIAVE